MTAKATSENDRYFQVHGLSPTTPEALNKSLQQALATMRVTLYGESTQELSDSEVAVLRSGGVDLEERPGPDPMAQAATEFAAILSTSLTPAAITERLGVSPSRVRQMIADRSLYSIRLNSRRYVPIFQFQDDGRLIPGIGRVNIVLDQQLHPIEVQRWYTEPETDLLDANDGSVSPLNWLKAGYPVEPVIALAAEL